MILLIILTISLLLIFWQDIKLRHIHVVLPIITLTSSYFLIKPELNLMGLNILFLMLTLVVLTIYMSIKNKEILNPFKNYFGLGDLLFYLAISPLFFLYNYILFFILSMLFAIAIQKIFKKSINQNSVPLAGLSALLLILILVKDITLPIQKITLINL
jgi:hypothetical protein